MYVKLYVSLRLQCAFSYSIYGDNYCNFQMIAIFTNSTSTRSSSDKPQLQPKEHFQNFLLITTRCIWEILEKFSKSMLNALFSW